MRPIDTSIGFEPERILIWGIDDEPDILASVELVLDQTGFGFEGFVRAQDALGALDERQPDLVLLDMMMPQMSGGEFLKAFRSRSENADVPVIVLTALASESSILNAFESGADDVVRKPFGVPELLARISWQLGRSRRLSALYQRSRDMELMTELARALSTQQELGRILDTVVSGVSEVLHAERCSVFLLDKETGKLQRKPREAEATPASPRPLDLALVNGAAASIARGEPVFLVDRDARLLMEDCGEADPSALSAVVLQPMAIDEELVGVLSVGAEREDLGQGDRDRRLLSILADLTAVAVDRVRLIASMRDEREKIDQANRQLAQTRDFLQNVIDSSPDAIVAATAAGEIVLYNRAAEQILGWTRQEAIGMSVRRLYPSGGAERIMSMLRAVDHGGRGRLEARREVVVDTSGREIPVAISAAVVYDGRGERATVGIFTDLRQRLEIEEKLQEATESLERTRRKALLAELAGAAAHELNQPLTSLLSYAERLRDQTDADDPRRRPVEIIHREAGRIAEIVQKIGKMTNYRTKDYVAGARIVDLEQSGLDTDPVEDPQYDERMAATTGGDEADDDPDEA